MSVKKIHIMLVDDHQLIIDGLSSLLSDVKNLAIVAQANNGQQAIEILKKKSIDVVLMDIEMPVMNGWDATQIIIARYPDTKIIALTTFSEKAIVKKMLSAGASGYILKNITKKTLVEAIVAVHNGKTYFSSEIEMTLLKPSGDEIITPKKDSSLDSLSSREMEVVSLIARGLSNKEIGAKLFLNHKTIDTHRTHLMEKLNIHNVAGIVRYAIENGLIE